MPCLKVGAFAHGVLSGRSGAIAAGAAGPAALAANLEEMAMPLQFPPIFRLALDASPKSRVRRRALRPGVDGLERREALSTTVAGIVAMGTPGAAKGAVETRLLVGTEVPKSFGTQGLLVLAGPAQRVDPAAQWEADIQALEQFLQDQEVPILVVESWPITGH